ncbi:hypothetical protein [Aureimonas leprariae]|uniref:Uncharacterized protein n=1 Tax=Plantimonas leprariae TaxID=2615207 RepID=A0A7V7TXC5_9HYPH|nr:hypothetical protein [Aureimonas leprariae]KAB0681369.1 hypothetical protein F6X38_05655 [Aureimonas leprariae]
MPENDQYPQHRRGRFGGIGLAIVAFAVAVLAVVFYQDRSQPTAPANSAAPLDQTVTGSMPANPNILVPPGSGSQSPTPP